MLLTQIKVIKCAELVDSLVGKRAEKMKGTKLWQFENTENKRGHKRKDEVTFRHVEFETPVGIPDVERGDSWAEARTRLLRDMWGCCHSTGGEEGLQGLEADRGEVPGKQHRIWKAKAEIMSSVLPVDQVTEERKCLWSVCYIFFYWWWFPYTIPFICMKFKNRPS